MNAKSILVSTLSLLFVSTLGITAEARERGDRRQVRQAERVHQGKESGQITPAEASRLRESKRDVRRTEKRAEADGVVTSKEKAHIEREQDARSRQINRIKHNDKTIPQTPAEPVNAPGLSK